MAVKKTSKKQYPSDNFLKELQRRERSAANGTAKAVARQRSEHLPPLMTMLIWTIVIAVVGGIVVFNVSQQIKINNNREQFVSLQEMIEDVRTDKSLSTPGSEWVKSGRCKSVPYTDFDLTYEQHKEWLCSTGTQRAIGASEDGETVRARLISVVGKHFTINKHYYDSDDVVALEVAEGLRCFITLGLKDEYGETGGIRIGCSDGAYKPWYEEGAYKI